MTYLADLPEDMTYLVILSKEMTFNVDLPEDLIYLLTFPKNMK